MKCACGHCHCPICGNQMTEAKVVRLAALREVREMVAHDLDCNADDPCQHMARHLMRLNALIKREEEGR